MRLYYAPLACSLADHIALHDAGADLDLVRVDTRSKLTETGEDFRQIGAKCYVPALVLDDGQPVGRALWGRGAGRLHKIA